MKSTELATNLGDLFDKWNKGLNAAGKVADLNGAIEFAANNGITLILEIPKSLLDSKAVTKPIKREDAIIYSSRTTEDSIIFEIPPKNAGPMGESKKLVLSAVENYRDFRSVLQLKHRINGLFAIFIPGEITKLGIE